MFGPSDSPLVNLPDPLEIHRRLSTLLREVSLLKRLQRIAIAAQRDLQQRNGIGEEPRHDQR
jgi:hypothetical protein